MTDLKQMLLAGCAAALAFTAPQLLAQQHGAADHSEQTTEAVGDSELTPGKKKGPDVAVDVPAAGDGDDEIDPAAAARRNGKDDQSALGEIATGEESIHHPTGRRESE